MKNLKLIFSVLFFVALVTGCGEKRIVEEFTPYDPVRIETNDGNLSYENFTSYPIIGDITGTTPTFTVDGAYRFRVDTVVGPSDSAFVINRFSIDPDEGVITYDNETNSLSPGEYVITVGIQTAKGLAIYNDIVTMQIDAVPIEVMANEDTIDVGALELGPIATVSIKDTSGVSLITDLLYELVGAPSAYVINEITGEISKTESTDQGIVPLSVRVTTNLGIVNVVDLLAIRVGSSPTLKYVQQDGTTPLSQVTLSSWSPYVTAPPTLEGMNAASWELILPSELEAVAGSFSVQPSGALEVAADANLPEGSYSLGMIATNAGGVAKEFPDVFTLNVEFRWEPFLVDSINNMENGVLPEAAFPGIWAGYDLSGSAPDGWLKVANVGGGNFSGMRRFNPGTLDACLTRTIDLTGVRALRVSFGELIGYGGAFTDRYGREFSYGTDVSNLANAVYDPADWNVVMDDGGPWLGINWNAGSGPVNEYNNMQLDLSNISGNTLYLMWRLYSKDIPAGNQNGQFIIDYVSADRASLFPAEEE
ncbi:MAG: hypothetical protein AAFV07_13940 [Bacteroidota bacterium]